MRGKAVMFFLPRLMVLITRKPRYLPEIKWSSKSWVHNIFRVYEMLFWRKIGIRAEISTLFDGKNLIHQAHSFEGACALLEQTIRGLFKFHIPVKIWIPVLSTPEGLPFPNSPFSFAIALDAATVIAAFSSSSPLTWNHTVTGSNPFIAIGVGLFAGLSIPSTSAVTYNSVSATKARADSVNIGNNCPESSVWFLGNPSTGTNQVSATWSGGSLPQGAGLSVSYTGAQSNNTADASNGTTGSTTGDKTFTVTTVADNCWIFVMGVNDNSSAPTLTSDQTSRGTLTSGTTIIRGGDTNAAQTPPGNKTVGMTVGGGGTEHAFAITGASFGVFVAGTPVSVSDSISVAENVTIVTVLDVDLSNTLTPGLKIIG